MAKLKAKRSQAGKSEGGGEVKKLIRSTRQATRKRYSAEEKIRIVMEGIRGDDPVSTIRRREGIHSSLYYRWLKAFMEAGKARLKGDEQRGATRGEVQDLQRENERLKRLVAELADKNVGPTGKKDDAPGARGSWPSARLGCYCSFTSQKRSTHTALTFSGFFGGATHMYIRACSLPVATLNVWYWSSSTSWHSTRPPPMPLRFARS